MAAHELHHHALRHSARGGQRPARKYDPAASREIRFDHSFPTSSPSLSPRRRLGHHVDSYAPERAGRPTRSSCGRKIHEPLKTPNGRAATTRFRDQRRRPFRCRIRDRAERRHAQVVLTRSPSPTPTRLGARPFRIASELREQVPDARGGHPRPRRDRPLSWEFPSRPARTGPTELGGLTVTPIHPVPAAPEGDSSDALHLPPAEPSAGRRSARWARKRGALQVFPRRLHTPQHPAHRRQGRSDGRPTFSGAVIWPPSFGLPRHRAHDAQRGRTPRPTRSAA